MAYGWEVCSDVDGSVTSSGKMVKSATECYYGTSELDAGCSDALACNAEKYSSGCSDNPSGASRGTCCKAGDSRGGTDYEM